jgi:cyclase
MDADGTKKGFELNLTFLVSSAVNIPVVASGRAGSKEDFYAVFTKGFADAALAASLFHYNELEIKDLKEYIRSKGVNARL